MDKIIEKLQSVSLEESFKLDLPNEDLSNVPSAPERYIQISYLEENLEKTEPEFTPFSLSDSDIFDVSITNWRRLTSGDDAKRTFLVTLDIKETGIGIEPGDAVSLIFPNSCSEVDALISRLQLEENAKKGFVLSVKPDVKKKTAKVPEFLTKEKLSIKDALRWHLDIRCVPKKPLLRCLSDYTSDPIEKKTLLYLCSRQGSQAYLDTIRAPNLCLLDLLISFPSCRPDITLLFEHLPRLQPRPYSAASHFDPQIGVIDVVFSVVDIPRGEGRRFSRKGVATGWFEDSIFDTDNKNARVKLFRRSNNTFRLPTDYESRDVIMIGPGTGVAPFRGFIQKMEKESLQKTDKKRWLFFGNRHRDQDFLFQSELETYEKTGLLTNLSVCFSRDNDEVKYVQDLVARNEAELVPVLMDDKTFIFVCGDAKNMAKDLREQLEKSIANINNWDISKAKSHLDEMTAQKRYLQDVWI